RRRPCDLLRPLLPGLDGTTSARDRPGPERLQRRRVADARHPGRFPRDRPRLRVGDAPPRALTGLVADPPGPWLRLTAPAAAALAAALVSAAAAHREPAAGRVARRDYLTLTKPRIMTLLLLTAACGMVVGANGLPRAATFAATMLGLALACGGASAFNHLL